MYMVLSKNSDGRYQAHHVCWISQDAATKLANTLPDSSAPIVVQIVSEEPLGRAEVVRDFQVVGDIRGEAHR